MNKSTRRSGRIKKCTECEKEILSTLKKEYHKNILEEIKELGKLFDYIRQYQVVNRIVLEKLGNMEEITQLIK
tara:strand:+ start:191 stop:409 length:219 start_codon:yes stop_codon:yes gene_type:complete